jgi:hypothetical protein
MDEISYFIKSKTLLSLTTKGAKNTKVTQRDILQCYAIAKEN